ncbi:hypothetical protein RZS08_07270, partial [Arthrospira platensis SPKY1]|nr:hypothetical protein [Arthrospira platensis SPKY1]
VTPVFPKKLLIQVLDRIEVGLHKPSFFSFSGYVTLNLASGINFLTETFIHHGKQPSASSSTYRRTRRRG